MYLYFKVGDILSSDNGDEHLDENKYLLNMANSSNPVLRIGKIGLPASKNILIKNRVTHELEGIVAEKENQIFIVSNIPHYWPMF